MSPVLLELLRCPETGQRLVMAGEETVALLECRRREQTLRFGSVAPGPLQVELNLPISAGFLREDGRIFYPIQNGIPILLPGHGMLVESV